MYEMKTARGALPKGEPGLVWKGINVGMNDKGGDWQCMTDRRQMLNEK